MDETEALAVLTRFDRVIISVARQVAETFSAITEEEDVYQEASLLVLSYAGMVPGGRLPGELAKVTDMTGGNEERIVKLISTQLKMDLNQMYGREADKTEMTVSIDTIEEDYLPPSFDVADALKNEVDFRKRYPTLALWLVDDQTEEQIADMAGVTIRTVERRIAKEKRSYLERYCRRGGLRVEGDETLDELQEACGHLKAAGR